MFIGTSNYNADTHVVWLGWWYGRRTRRVSLQRGRSVSDGRAVDTIDDDDDERSEEEETSNDDDDNNDVDY